ncbi:hypothetical protein GZ78_23980 [Endozoicomonas numazuensis]|uniref:Uncharacterized protein n=1 Tax=Endozoicomonas numazuensis TaxID=1137799 RepID=A0A081NCV1_9GAMM|nr:hypothetical protein GZ78_23980 [Endozoicomonas numazuensis]
MFLRTLPIEWHILFSGTASRRQPRGGDAIYPAISKEIAQLTGKQAVFLNLQIQKVRRVEDEPVLVETYQNG